MRHAPKPDEDGVEWNPDEIDMTQRPDHLAGQYKDNYGNVDVNPNNDEENQHQYMRRPGIPAKGVPRKITRGLWQCVLEAIPACRHYRWRETSGRTCHRVGQSTRRAIQQVPDSEIRHSHKRRVRFWREML
jgi:hypothetical protein